MKRELKFLLSTLVEQLLRDGYEPVRFALFLFSLLFFGLMGYFLEKNIVAVIGFVLVPLAVFGIILVNGVYYLQDIYELDDFSKVFRYLIGALFHFSLPTLKVMGGKKALETGELNTLDRIGGPGTLFIEPGNAVILETLTAPSRILGPGEYEIFRNEVVKAIVSLEKRDGSIDEVIATTQDGIDVKISNIKYQFCINKGQTELRAPENPYPFSVRAVYSLTYERAIDATGELGDWADVVKGIVRGIISEHVAAHTLDMLMAPGIIEHHPLENLRLKFEDKVNRDKFAKAGVDLLWINIGTFTVCSADVEEQRLKIWSARQEGRAKVMRAQGESENISSRERGRAEGQVILLKSIAQALSEIHVGENDSATAKNLWNIVLARTAQILEAMTSLYTFGSKRDDQDGNQRKW